MDPLTRWEAAAITSSRDRPRPGSGGSTVDLRDHHPADRPASEPPAEPPSDTLLVPLDAWNRMLNQLGNLHEAGRELAEARERAARAETEADFLRERVADLRERLAAAERADEPEGPGDTTGGPEPAASERFFRAVYGGLRARIRR